MSTVSAILILFVAVTALAVAARRAKLPYPALMVVGGLLISISPGLPRLQLDPDIFFSLFLPPLLYAAAWQTSWRDFRFNLRSISLLATGFVIVTTCTIAYLAHLAIGGMTWPAAFALGAIVSPPDAVAATAIAGPLGIPRRLVTILEGESLLNDASGLTLYRLAVAAAVSGTFSLGAAATAGVLAVVVGIAMGLALGWVVMRLHRQMDDPLVETVITLLTPFAAFQAAERLHGSGVLAVVVMGLYVSRHSHEIFSSETRLQAVTVWDTTIFLLNGLVFVLVGLQLPLVLRQIHSFGEPSSRLIEWSIALCVVMVIVRIIWVFPATYLPRLFFPSIRKRDPYPKWQAVFFVAYTGMRGADSLAAALALPIAVASGARFPRRDLIIFLTFVAILGSLVVQSLTLPGLVRWLGLQVHESDGCEEWDARLRAARSALEHITSLQVINNGKTSRHAATLRRLQVRYEERVQRLDAVRSDEEHGICASEKQVDGEIYRDVLEVERLAVVNLRNTNVIGDEVLRRIIRDLDLEEAGLGTATA